VDHKYFIKITSRFKDVSELLIEIKKAKAVQNKLRRRLKTKILKYLFLKDIVDINCSAERLTKAVKKYLKEIGLEKVILKENSGEEDLQIWFEDRVILVEVTGTKSGTHKDSKTIQISKHIPVKRELYPDLKVSGLFISNHNFDKPFNQRNENPFSSEQINFARTGSYTLATTIDLLALYGDYRRGKITTQEIINRFCNFGKLDSSENKGS
jgi:hypothetical protein